MICRKCKKEMPEAPYCPWCGTEQAQKRQSRRRGNGQGTAIKRGKTWTAIYSEPSYVDEDGKLHYPRKWKGGFATKNDALKYALSPKETSETPTLRSYYSAWKASADMSKSKLTAYKIAWGKLSALSNRRMDEITINDLQSTINNKAETYYPAKDMKQLLSNLFKMAVAEGNAKTNLAEFIKLPRLEEKEAEPFTEDEIKAIWGAYSSGYSFAGYILIMIYTGMMPIELLGLESPMIDFEKREIIGCGRKTKKRKTTPIVFPEVITPILRNLPEGKAVAVNRDTFYKYYHATLTDIGVRDLPPYSCRHTTATALAMGNIAPSVIQEVMRHTKFQTTQRYIHPDTESAHAAVDTLK